MSNKERIERMECELKELSTKIVALVKFAHSDNVTFCKLPTIEQESLCEQLEHMESYRDVLSSRLSRALSE